MRDLNFNTGKYIVLFLVCHLFMVSGSHAQGWNYLINEIAPLNTDITDEYGEYDDWIEIYNADSEVAWLDDVYFTDNFEEPLKWKFEGPYKIQPGGFLIIWMDGEPHQGEFHASFRLKLGGEQIAMTQIINNEIHWIDSVSFGRVHLNTSYGRTMDGGPEFSHLTDITPGSTNNISTRYMEGPEITPGGMILTGPHEISISSSDLTAQIYYTIDGSEPTQLSVLYENPFVIDSTCMVNAKTFKSGYSGSTSRHSFVLKPAGNLPLVTLDLARDDLFDDEKGIYVRGTNGISGGCVSYPANWNQDWEKPGRLSFYENNAVQIFSTLAGIKIGGGCSRGLNMKSFNVFFRNRYESSSINYPIFPQSEIKEYSRLKIRNAGTDNGSMMLRDGLNQLLLRDEMDIDLMDFRPSVLFLNGEFWGMYSLREFINDDYIYSHHGYKKDEIDLIKSPFEWTQVKVGNDSAFRALYDFIEAYDLSNDTYFSYVADHIDINEYINYNIAQIYLANYDWPSINTYIWKPKQGGKWRWVLFDTDGSTNFDLFYDTYPEYNSLAHAIIPMFEKWPNSERSTLFLRKMLENETFRNEFVQRTSSYAALLFSPGRVNRITDSLVNMIDPFVDPMLEKWGTNIPELGWSEAMGGSREKWEENVQLYKNFFAERAPNIQEFYETYFEFDGSFHLTLKHDQDSHGKVYVNSNHKELPHGFEADYFKNIPLKLRAIPDEGYRFYKWLEIDDPNAFINFTSSENASLTPLFTLENSIGLNEKVPMRIYPNPSKGMINLQIYPLSHDHINVLVYNSRGQLVVNELRNCTSDFEALRLDLGHLQDGVYFIILSNDKMHETGRIVIMKEI